MISILILAALLGGQIRIPGPGGKAPGGGGGSPTLVQTNNCTATSATNCTVSLTGVVTGHTFAVCDGSNQSGLFTVPTTTSDTFIAAAAAQTGSGSKSRCFYVLSTTQSGSVSINCPAFGTGANGNCFANELSGVTGIDCAVSQTNGSSASLTFNLPSTCTTGHANELAIGYATANSSATTIVACIACGGWAIPSNGSVISPVAGAVETITGVASSTNLTGSFTSGTSLFSTAWVVTFY